MATILLQAISDDTVAAVKAYAAEAGVSPGEFVTRLVEFYTQLRVSDEPAVVETRRVARLP